MKQNFVAKPVKQSFTFYYLLLNSLKTKQQNNITLCYKAYSHYIQHILHKIYIMHYY